MSRAPARVSARLAFPAWAGIGSWGFAGVLSLGFLLIAIAGCGPGSPALSGGALLVTQTPLESAVHEQSVDTLDLLYPPGSRIVLVQRPDRPDQVIPLSPGLRAAGGPVLSPDGREVLFTAKTDAASPWQIYRVALKGGRPECVTSLPGGSMAPAWLPAGRLVFSSPVPRLAADAGAANPALFTQASTGGAPVRLTFGLAPAIDPTVLRDGRILFVSGVPATDGSVAPATSLFTINNDGTEVSAYAGQHDGPASTRRPRETGDGRIVFLAAGAGTPVVHGRIEQVLTARPFRSRSVAFPQISAPCRAAEPLADGSVLATLRETGPDRALASFAIYRLLAGATRVETPIFDDPAWNDVEAVSATQPPRPMGRLSNVDPERHDATLLCLDAGLSDRATPTPTAAPAAGHGQRVRLVRHSGPGPGDAQPLGEAPVHADGSFLVTVPADAPLAIELLDPDHNVLRRCPPAFWLRPGENRACVGCHEPHNHAPENLRPLAVRELPVRLLADSAELTQAPTNRGK